jgi:nucleotide-binding universal stress UspA family protein
LLAGKTPVAAVPKSGISCKGNSLGHASCEEQQMNSKLGYRRILVAADFSPASQAALNQAVWIARESGSKIVLLHVLPDLRRTMYSASVDAKLDLLYGEGARFYQEILGDSENRMRCMISEAGSPEVEIHTKTLPGEPLVEICRAVQQAKHDLVIAGTRGLANWKTFFVGSTSQRLIRKCPAPVWIVKPGHVGKPQSILAVTDFSATSRRAVIAGLAIAEDAQASFHLLHVIDSGDVPENAVAVIPEGSSLRQEINEAAKHRFDEFVASLDSTYPVEPHLSWGTPWQEINRLAGELNVDLIAIGTVGRTSIPGLFLGNTAEKVLSKCDCSILTMKPEDFQSPIPLMDSTTRIYDRGTVLG